MIEYSYESGISILQLIKHKITQNPKFYNNLELNTLFIEIEDFLLEKHVKKKPIII